MVPLLTTFANLNQRVASATSLAAIVWRLRNPAARCWTTAWSTRSWPQRREAISGTF
jgi:hypothetical protein